MRLKPQLLSRNPLAVVGLELTKLKKFTPKSTQPKSPIEKKETTNKDKKVDEKTDKNNVG